MDGVYTHSFPPSISPHAGHTEDSGTKKKEPFSPGSFYLLWGKGNTHIYPSLGGSNKIIIRHHDREGQSVHEAELAF